MIEMILLFVSLWLPLVGLGLIRRKKMLATNVAIVWLERQGPGQESRENGRP